MLRLKTVFTTFLALFFCLCFSNYCFSFSSKRFLDRPEVHSFIEKMVHKHQFSRTELQRYFAKAKLQDAVLIAIAKPYEAKPWHQYREIFITESHIQNGLRFWKKHADTLARAETEYGVPAEIIVAILGIETRYGENTGRFPVFDTLSTLAFEYPPRSAFFKDELEEYLLLVREEGFDPHAIKGSYAGAMGTPQFIASSYRRYAVDFTGTGKRDLLHSPEDAIGSIANYFHQHGWQVNQPIVAPTKVQGSAYLEEQWSPKEPKPRHSGAQLEKMGIQVANPAWKTSKMALIPLEIAEGTEFWLGFQNFYVITRYNHSNNYAMAVVQLSQKLKELRS